MRHLGRSLLTAVPLLVLVAAACGEVPSPTATPPAQQASQATPVTAAPTATPVSAPPTATPPSQPPAAAAPVEARIAPALELAADIKDFTLPDLVVRVGTRVTWTNRDRSPHTSTSGSKSDPTGIWDSEFLREGEAFSFTFTETGAFNYFCSVHPDTMNSVVTVVAADQSVTPSGSDAPAQAAAAADTPTPVPPAPTSTDTPEPTAVPSPAPTARLVAKSTPTATPEPTATPVPETTSNTPVPTSTATSEPTATASPAPTATPSPPPATDTSPPPVKSSIVDFRLQDLTISVGTTIEWVQEDIAPHTTTAGTPGSPTGMWDSGLLDTGGTFSFTFGTPGTFAYFCEIHPDIMTATVTVVEGTAGAAGTPAPAAGGDGEGYSD